MEALLGLLGLARRAGAAVVGVDAVRAEIQRGAVACLVVADDASPRAHEKVVRLAAARGVPQVTGPGADAIGARLGLPPVMVVGIRDRALAEGILRSAAPDR